MTPEELLLAIFSRDPDDDIPDLDPETSCAVCNNDTPTNQCCGQPFDIERSNDR